MSSVTFSEPNSSPIQTRRAPTKNEDKEKNPQRRSLSGKFRNLFRKNSSSPTRSVNNEGRLPPQVPSRQRSVSPEPIRTSTEAPHLRAPIVHWPFGKKKTKLNAPASDKTKPKQSQKSKKTSAPPMEISSPIYEQEHQTSIRGQNFVPRTPELTHGVGRTQSSSSYETETKGFRDYMIIDKSKSSEQAIVTDVDVITPPPYISDHSRSPSLNHQHLSDTNIEHSYHHDSPISEIEIQRHQYTGDDTSGLTTTQILVGHTPLLPPTVTRPIHTTTNANQWKNTSHSSLNNTELRSTTSASMDIDIPRLNTPLISLSSRSSKQESQPTNSQFHHNDTYHSSSTVNNLIQSNQPHTNTYSSLPDTSTIIHSESFNSSKPTKSNLSKHSGISAIIDHHMRPISVHFNERSPTISSQQTQRFETSTTTLNDYDQRQQWSTNSTNGSVPSPSSIHQHDGYIRPLTPQKPSIQPDISMIEIHLDDLRGQSSPRTSHYNSPDPPIIYRSSTIIYTRDKHNYPNGGELRTWSLQKDDDFDENRKPSTSVQIHPPKIANDYQYNSKTHEDEYPYEYERQEYPTNRYSDKVNNSNFIQSNEREKIHDQSTRSHKHTDSTQETLNTINPVENSEVALRHYTIKRTKSYDGLGILISADVKTRLNHRIRDIETGSPGSRSGLRKNDRITHINGINIENTEFGDVLVLIKQGLTTNNNLQLSVIHESTIV